MNVTVQQIVESIQTLRPSKWHWDINYFAEGLEITVEQANGSIKCIETGGSGSRAEGSWKANPNPFNIVIDLTQNQDDALNLHYKDSDDKCQTSFEFEAPYAAILDQPSRHIFVGRISSQNKSITIKVQREIVRYIIGSHQTMTQSYPEWAENGLR